VNPSFYGEFESRRTSGVWVILNRLLIAAIILTICAGGALAFIPLFKQRSETQEKIDKLQAAITREKALLARNVREVEMLKNNPEYVELIARDKLNLMKPGETIVRLEGEGPSALQPPKAGR